MSFSNAFFCRFWKLIGFQNERWVKLPGHTESPTYYIVRRTLGWGSAGFFSNYFYALSHIAYAKSLGFVPVVDMHNYRTLYSEKKPVNGTSNVWEYYFSQPVTISQAYSSGNFVLSDGVNPVREFLPFQETDSSCELITGLSVQIKNVASEYLRIRPDLVADFNDFFKSKLGGGTSLGIHYRGTDKHDPPSGHRFAASVEQVLLGIEKLRSRNSIDRIFLASDENGIGEIIQNETGLPVSQTDSFRMKMGSLHAIHTTRPAEPRPLHRYLLGVEVLRDAYLLSCCDMLLYGHSNISNAALFFREEPFRDKYLMPSPKLS